MFHVLHQKKNKIFKNKKKKHPTIDLHALSNLVFIFKIVPDKLFLIS